ncbi:hypothetical protein LW135_05405 [Helicobacter sp. faydin-H20]|uniref:hypothetical protein n=1 Tax=Helicobacter anatolicus TaxID=2905874 RepID=UPI001E38237E|nr:hypothetical protein [Helicobacter anatolicus]MCE3037266.1 hypothetical protein [Helicobacter anatolicus]
MIQKITSLSQSISKLSHQKDFNNTLPVLLNVLEKQGKDLYKIKIGNLTTQTKSQKDLIVGAQYFANLQKSSIGTLLLNQLTPYPKNLEILQDSPLKLSFQNLKEIFSKGEDFIGEWKEFLLNQFSDAPDKNSFLFFGNLLLSLQKNVISFNIYEDKKNYFLQLEKRQEESLGFYALYPNLGPLSGVVYKTLEKDIGLNLQASFESTKNLLKNHTKDLKLFHRIEISLQKNIEPLYHFTQNLLDLRG